LLETTSCNNFASTITSYSNFATTRKYQLVANLVQWNIMRKASGAVACRKGERTGRRPQASKAGGIQRVKLQKS